MRRQQETTSSKSLAGKTMAVQRFVAGFNGANNNYFTTKYSIVVDDDNDQVAGMFIAGADKTIEKVHVQLEDVNGSIDLTCSIQTVDTNNDPTGTTYTGGSGVTVTAVQDALTEFSFGSCDVDQGEVFAVVVEGPSGGGGGNDAEVIYGWRAQPDTQKVLAGRYTTDGGTTWNDSSSNRGANAIIVEYSDGSYEVGSISRVDQGPASNYDTGTTYDTCTISFKVPFDTTMKAVYLYSNITANADFNLYLLEGEVADLGGFGFGDRLAGYAVDVSQVIQGTGYKPALFPLEYSLTANTWYTVCVEATTSINHNIYESEYASTAMRETYEGDCYLGRKDSGTESADARGKVFAGSIDVLIESNDNTPGLILSELQTGSVL